MVKPEFLDVFRALQDKIAFEFGCDTDALNVRIGQGCSLGTILYRNPVRLNNQISFLQHFRIRPLLTRMFVMQLWLWSMTADPVRASQSKHRSSRRIGLIGGWRVSPFILSG